MKFCERCGSMLFPAKIKSTYYWKCRTCGRKKVSEVKKLRFERKYEHKKKILIEEKPKLPQTTKSCPKCESSKAYFWIQQTGIEDGPPTQFFKCVKCGYIWREE